MSSRVHLFLLIKEAITLSDQVIVNPDDTVTEGMEVNVK